MVMTQNKVFVNKKLTKKINIFKGFCNETEALSRFFDERIGISSEFDGFNGIYKINENFQLLIFIY